MTDVYCLYFTTLIFNLQSKAVFLQIFFTIGHYRVKLLFFALNWPYQILSLAVPSLESLPSNHFLPRQFWPIFWVYMFWRWVIYIYRIHIVDANLTAFFKVIPLCQPFLFSKVKVGQNSYHNKTLLYDEPFASRLHCQFYVLKAILNKNINDKAR
jgi:hypothetical protein